MKKTLIILSILILVLTLISCSNTEITENNNLEEQTDEKEIVIKEDTESDLVQDKETEAVLPEENIESLDTENELEEVFEDDFDMDDLDAEFEEMDSLLEGW